MVGETCLPGQSRCNTEIHPRRSPLPAIPGADPDRCRSLTWCATQREWLGPVWRWLGLKQTVAANRCYPSLAELTHRTLAWLEAMRSPDRLRLCDFDTS